MNNINKKAWIAIALALMTGLFLGYLFFNKGATEEHRHQAGEEPAQASTWTCSMHPQIRQPDPGQCPICGMDLIPVAEEGGENNNPMVVQMSETAARLANIQTLTVGTGSAIKTLSLNGKVMPNERLVKTQSSHVSGRVEQLFVNTTGEQVRAGQKLAILYSPELISAQRELLQGMVIKESQPALYRAAREKLKALRLTEEQIDRIEEAGKVQENTPVYADRSGIVLKKMVNVGDYLEKGEALFTIADLSKVWVVFDAYESDLPFLQIDDKLSFTVASLPAKEFSGEVTFIDPIVNSQSRTAQVRVEIENTEGRLKPEMFAQAEIEARLGSESQMTVPKSAVMWTGERSIVYVQVMDGERKGYELREVLLGPALGGAYVIESGIEPGEQIVVNGTFTVDAAAQLAGKPSMMNPEGGAAITGHSHGASNASNLLKEPNALEASAEIMAEINTVLQAYFTLKDALVATQEAKAAKSARALESAVNRVSMNEMKPQVQQLWMKILPQIKEPLAEINRQANIDVQRKAFIELSEAIISVAQAFGPFDKPVYLLNCPMANNNQGANWLSSSEEVLNPYYGDLMLRCGELVQTID